VLSEPRRIGYRPLMRNRQARGRLFAFMFLVARHTLGIDVLVFWALPTSSWVVPDLIDAMAA
jgi:hypothetical protein